VTWPLFRKRTALLQGLAENTQGSRRYWGGPPLGVQILYTFPTPKTGMKQIEQFNDIILRILRFLAESSGVTRLEVFQRFPHCK